MLLEQRELVDRLANSLHGKPQIQLIHGDRKRILSFVRQPPQCLHLFGHRQSDYLRDP